LDVKNHNLMMRLIAEKRSLSRIKAKHVTRNNNDKECRNFLKLLKKNKEGYIKELEERLGKTSIRNLEMKHKKSLRAMLMKQGSPEKGIAELSKWYNLPIK